jgi:hypothetical protein
MNLIAKNVELEGKVWGIMASFGTPLSPADLTYLKANGLNDGRTKAVGCIGWIWSKWLLGEKIEDISNNVEPFVKRGMEMKSLSRKFMGRPMHDLLLLHCAILGSNEAQLNQLAETILDSSGFLKYEPINDGELYMSALCGMMKYWILGDLERATKESEVAFAAYHSTNLRAASKQLITPWLKKDWKAFSKNQTRDFEKLWNRSRKDGSVVRETRQETVVDMRKFSSVQQLWCWNHCGMAILAHRSGAEVVTDPLWFPEVALSRVS